ncbi:MAG: CinA family protein [Gammaproteobacteria bacterium]|nr:CinA family protein [Gammaproteobacteria bacterium]
MDNLEDLIGVRVELLAERMQQKGWRLACAESCTGGLLAKSCTDVAGSSRWFECAYVTYSNEAKSAMLDVPPELLEANGAVSVEVAQAMVKGVLDKAGVDVGVSITGIAGPGGGTPEKPVGTVCFGFAAKGRDIELSREVFRGDRNRIRQQSVLFALDKLLKIKDSVSE